MNVSVRLGAGLSAQAPRPRFDLRLGADATVQEAVDALKVLAPDIAVLVNRAVLAVGGQAVDATQVLHEGDEVSIVVPVAGGLADL